MVSYLLEIMQGNVVKVRGAAAQVGTDGQPVMLGRLQVLIKSYVAVLREIDGLRDMVTSVYNFATIKDFATLPIFGSSGDWPHTGSVGRADVSVPGSGHPPTQFALCADGSTVERLPGQGSACLSRGGPENPSDY